MRWHPDEDAGAHLPESGPRPLSQLMYWAWLSRPQLGLTFSLDDSADRRRFVLWFLLRGRSYLGIHEGWTADFRNSRHYLERALHALSNALGPVLAAVSALLPVSLRKRLLHFALDSAARVLDPANVQEAISRTAAKPCQRNYGVTLIGYAKAELGLGEYLRKSALALQKAEVPIAVLDCSHIAPHRKYDNRLAALTTADNPFPVNFFHVTADKMFNACTSFAPDAVLGRYNIGAWMWELARFPPELLYNANILDEIWAPSKFVQGGLSGSPVPVYHMPVCVTVELARTATRAEFGLPADQFLFVFSLDFYSFLERKNPAGVVRAFRRAFFRGDEPAGLVLKVMNASRRDPRWRALSAVIQADPRIKVFDQTLDYNDWLAILSLCDAYVSLHRSEGFGFGPAEAMCLGKPVIVTGYGGVTDFARPDTALIVEHRLIPLEPGQYLFGDGQVWADPDVEHAARHMRDLAADRDYARRVGTAGRDFMRRHHAPTVVGRIYRDRLQDILKARQNLNTERRE